MGLESMDVKGHYWSSGIFGTYSDRKRRYKELGWSYIFHHGPKKI